MRKLLPGELGTPTMTALMRDEPSGKWVPDPASPTKAPRWRAAVKVGTTTTPHQLKREDTTKVRARDAALAAATQWWADQGAAEEAVLLAQRQAEKGGSFRQMIQSYLTNPRNMRTGESLRENSMSNYRYGAKLLCESSLGDLTADQIKPTMLAALYIKVAVADGHGTSAAQAVRKVARVVLDGPVADGVITFNPARAKLPGFPMGVAALVGPDQRVHDTGIDHQRAATDEEVQALITGLYGDPEALPMESALNPNVRRKRTVNGAAGTETKNGKDIADLSMFLWSTGCRVGEALAMRWSDLDLRRAGGAQAYVTGTTIYQHPLKDTNGKIVVPGKTVRQDRPKTAGSVRPVPLGASVVAMLRARAEVFGADLNTPEDLPIFGSPQKPREFRERHNLQRDIKRLYTRHGMPWARAHAARSYQITAMTNSGVPLAAIQRDVGHDHAATTFRYIKRATETAPEVRRFKENAGLAFPVPAQLPK